MKSRTPKYLALELALAIVLGVCVLATDWVYQAGNLSKGSALGMTALFLLAAAVAFVGFLVDLLVIGFRMKSPEVVNG